jgi:hypothetical protein
MLALAFALSSGLLAATVPATDTLAIVPRRMSLDLVIDPAREGWNGSARGWLTVRRPVRSFVLRFTGPVLSTVEMNQLAGSVPLTFGTPRHDSLWVVTDRGLVPGPAGLNVAYLGAFADSGRGLVRRGPGTVVLDRGAARVVPAWPEGAPLPAWAIDVHVPAGCTVRANLPRKEITRQLGWRTWSFASKRPMDPDSLRLEVRRPRTKSR